MEGLEKWDYQLFLSLFLLVVSKESFALPFPSIRLKYSSSSSLCLLLQFSLGLFSSFFFIFFFFIFFLSFCHLSFFFFQEEKWRSKVNDEKIQTKRRKRRKG